jgi:hypothetical protein
VQRSSELASAADNPTKRGSAEAHAACRRQLLVWTTSIIGASTATAQSCDCDSDRRAAMNNGRGKKKKKKTLGRSAANPRPVIAAGLVFVVPTLCV